MQRRFSLKVQKVKLPQSTHVLQVYRKVCKSRGPLITNDTLMQMFILPISRDQFPWDDCRTPMTLLSYDDDHTQHISEYKLVTIRQLKD